MIKAAIFDLGNVLIDFDHRIAARRISGFTDKTGEEIYNLFFDSQVTELFEEGKISPPDFFSRVKEILNLRIGYEEFLPIWNEIFFFSQKNADVYNIAMQLKKNYRLAVLSNINILHFEYIKKTFPVLDAFHHIITSYEVGASKPKRQIYDTALGQIKSGPQETFYTDDRPELIAGARQLGLQAFVFKEASQLKKDLSGCGVILD